MTPVNSNPFLHLEFPLAFDRYRPDQIEPAISELIRRSEARLEAIASADAPRTYENTLAAFDHMTEDLDGAYGLVRHLELTVSTPELRAAFNAVEAPVTAFYARICLHDGLYRAIEAFAGTPEAAALTGARKRLLEKTLSDFRRRGAGLAPEKKAALEKIEVELSRHTTKFSENVVDSTKEFEILIDDESRLAGLPPSALAMLRQSAEAKGLTGWRITLQAPCYLAVMTYLDDAALRQRVYRAFQTRASSAPWDNRANIGRILELRREKAHLLGYPDFADFITEERMAKSGVAAQTFLEDLRRRTVPYFERENEQLLTFRREVEGPSAPPLEAWDVGYWAEKLRKSRYDFEEEALRPYFSLDRVVAGMFQLVHRLFGIEVVPRQGVPGWDPAVQFYEIRDGDGSLIGAFYTDWFPRETKRQGAWMDVFLTGGPRSGGFAPHLGLMCGNMTPPAAGKPALLTHREVETVFHEFGHLLHHCLSRVEPRMLAGVNVPSDFVELPSQIMENWCWEREALDLFARHWETGAPLPDELFDRLVRTRTFRTANAQMRQLSFGFVDLALHRDYDAVRDGDVIAWSRKLLARFSPAPLPDDHAMLNAFSHLFSDPTGYAAGYYSYKWSEVLDADAFTRFRKEGVFSESAGMSFRTEVLEKGNSQDPAQLFRNFLGRDPNPEALLLRAGLA
ncbi:MAG: M3 family metallopeptidase [Bryobacteraceae bacterium]